MEVFNFEITGDKASIFFIGDIHEGNANHNSIAFNKTITKIKSTENAIVILMGDLCECINTRDPRFSPTELCREYSLRDLKDLPRKQFQKIFEKLKPIKDKIKGFTIGNHEEAFIKYSGFDVYDYFCTDLMGGTCEKLGKESIGRIRIQSPHSKSALNLKIALTHGKGGGGFREGYAFNHCLDTFKKFDADIHVMGHIHKLVAKGFKFLSINNVNRMIKKYKWYCVSGTYLESSVEGNSNYFEGSKGMLSEIGFIEVECYRKNDGWFYECLKHEY